MKQTTLLDRFRYRVPAGLLDGEEVLGRGTAGKDFEIFPTRERSETDRHLYRTLELLAELQAAVEERHESR